MNARLQIPDQMGKLRGWHMDNSSSERFVHIRRAVVSVKSLLRQVMSFLRAGPEISAWRACI